MQGKKLACDVEGTTSPEKLEFLGRNTACRRLQNKWRISVNNLFFFFNFSKNILTCTWISVSSVTLTVSYWGYSNVKVKRTCAEANRNNESIAHVHHAAVLLYVAVLIYVAFAVFYCLFYFPSFPAGLFLTLATTVQSTLASILLFWTALYNERMIEMT